MAGLGALLARSLEPRDSRPIYEWALEHVELHPPLTRTGPFDVSGSRHFIAVFDALSDERVREVNVLKPVRGGGSLIGDVYLVSCMARSPGPALNVYQTDPDARQQFEDRLEKLLTKGCKDTAALMPSRYTWDQFTLLNGHPIYTGGPALTNLQSKGVRYLRLDECWIYPQGRMTEAEGRVGDFLKMESSKILRISQGGPPEGRTLADDEWHRAYLRGAIHEWEVECPHCRKFFEPRFSGQREDGSFWGVQWDQHRLPNGDWDIAKCIPTVRFECPHCAKPMLDCPRTKSEWNRTGRFRLDSGGDQRRRMSFHWETVVDYPWDELVGLWLDACNAFERGNLTPKLQFYQKRRAQFIDADTLLKGALHFHKVEYELNSEWPEEKSRFLTVDRQDEDAYWWTVRAWSDTVTRRLGFGKCYGETGIKEVQERFKVKPNRVMIDSGFMPKGDHGVYAMCCRNGWFSAKGTAEWQFPHKILEQSSGRVRIIYRSFSETAWGDPEIGTSGGARKFAPLIRFSKDRLNAKVQELIDSGRWEEPVTSGDKAMDSEYANQMAARVRMVERAGKTGEQRVYWRESKNDHARDLANLQVLCALKLRLIRDSADEPRSAEDGRRNGEK